MLNSAPALASRLREIPYNYTSFSDREIVIRFLGEANWQRIERLRGSRRTGRSARMLFEVLGDLWVVSRNPYLQDDLIADPKRLQLLIAGFTHRLDQFEQRLNANAEAATLLAAARAAVNRCAEGIAEDRALRQQLRRALASITRPDTLDFGGLARVAHATDATDWRVELPFVVITPDTEAEVAPIVAACIHSGLSIIPRGGGTGYTGSAVPLSSKTAVINTEKLTDLSAVESYQLPDSTTVMPSVVCGAGVITRQVAALAESQGLAFAVDPTSQEASTIGGNVAMNAGGKKAVLWGTTLDNLLAWRMVMPDATWLEVERLGDQIGKLHELDQVQFRLQRFATDGSTRLGEPQQLTIRGRTLRQPGLGKDVTDKVLGGLPGVQKEGCDGLMTSVRLMLHRRPAHTLTLCLEFFGAELDHAVSAIVAIKAHVDAQAVVQIAGLEHLDERYVRAVGYSTKASRPEWPKMVLLADLVSDDLDAVCTVADEVIALAQARSGEGFIASSPEERQRFWQDRARTAAISRHTNAFKINEDVVIPLERLADYSQAIERINIEQSIRNKDRIMAAVLEYLSGPLSEARAAGAYSQANPILHSKRETALAVVNQARQRWQQLLAALDAPASAHLELLRPAEQACVRGDEPLLKLMLRRDLRQSYVDEVAHRLNEIFSGQAFAAVRQRLAALHQQERNRRLFVALHMHAGDGNVHTNIPVHSSDYAMLREADAIVDRIMALALALGGSISGEHGIGLTKWQYLAADKRAAFATYKQAVDPQGHFNPGKLLDGAGLEQAYTPSLQLLAQEAIILEETELGALNQDIKHCLRCGKCKPKCMTHVPRANLLYSPRNKILGAGQVIEAFLYEEQTRRGLSRRHVTALNDLADHCTVCHHCQPPCPVDIDFGDVTMRLRRILSQRGSRRINPGAWAAMRLLDSKDPRTIALLRTLLAKWGIGGLNLGQRLLQRVGLAQRLTTSPGATTEPPTAINHMAHLMSRSLPVAVPQRTYRQVLGLEDRTQIPLIRDPALSQRDDSESVFYFPGCGSERLFSDIGLASLALLFEQGVQTVLPPGYLCCGYPQRAAGREQQARQIVMENRVLLHRLAHTLNYLDIRTVLVSCGTCMDQLVTYEFERIFPECRLLDIHEFLLERQVTLSDSPPRHYLYHDPCHTPMKVYDPLTVASTLLGQPVQLSERCCGEAGTLGITRPDIANQVRFRKQQELTHSLEALSGAAAKLLTSCPACQQGLAKYQQQTGLTVDYIVVELARQRLGANWQHDFIERVKADGLEWVLL